MSEMQIEAPEGQILTELPIAPEPAVEPAVEPRPQVVAEEEPEGRQPKSILDDLRDERAERRALSQQVRDLEAQARLAPTLQRELDTLRSELAELKPKAPAIPVIPDELASASAVRYGLYTVSGEPDIKAGRAIEADLQNRTEQAAKRITQAELAPLREMTLKQQANHRVERAIAQVTADQSCTPETLRSVLSSLNDEQKANDDVISAAMVLASGLDARNGKTPKKPEVREVSEPLHTEASGGRRLTPGPLSEIEARAAKATGMTAEQWKTHTKDFEPGKPVRLE